MYQSVSRVYGVALFFRSSLIHSMLYLFLNIILSHMGISLFFILALSHEQVEYPGHLVLLTMMMKKPMNELNTLIEQTFEEHLFDVPSGRIPYASAKSGNCVVNHV